MGLQKLQGLQLPHQAPVAGHGDGAVGGGLQLQGEGLEDGAEEGTGEVREEDAHGVGTPRGQALGQGAWGVAQLLHRLEHRPHLLRGDPGGAVENPGHRGRGNARATGHFGDGGASLGHLCRRV